MAEVKWILCPICGQKTRNKIRTDTVLENYPLFCPKCKKECLIMVKNQIVTIVNEPDARR
ncbi:MAG: cysteine-rich KTR domain-containing protein [Lachnospiraceae bacterium]